MSILDSSAQQKLLQIADIASRRQAMVERCRCIEKSDFKCTMHGVSRLRSYRKELDEIEQELESAVKQWENSALPLTHQAP